MNNATNTDTDFIVLKIREGYWHARCNISVCGVSVCGVGASEAESLADLARDARALGECGVAAKAEIRASSFAA